MPPLLSRVAESLLWMGRYVERAENTARLLDVTYHGRLEPQSGEVFGATNTWQALTATLGLDTLYAAQHEAFNEAGVIAFLTVGRDNPSSITMALLSAPADCGYFGGGSMRGVEVPRTAVGVAVGTDVGEEDGARVVPAPGVPVRRVDVAFGVCWPGVAAAARGRSERPSARRLTNTWSSWPLPSRSIDSGPSGRGAGGVLPGETEARVKVPLPAPRKRCRAVRAAGAAGSGDR